MLDICNISFYGRGYDAFMLEDDDIFAVRKRMGARLRAIRKECFLSQEQIANLLFIDRSRVSRLESGKAILSFNEMVIFAYLFSLTLSELTEGVSIPKEDVSRSPLEDRLETVTPLAEDSKASPRDSRVFGHYEIGPYGWEHYLG